MPYQIVKQGQSRSFPNGDPFLSAAVETAPVLLYLGVSPDVDRAKTAILVELGTECLGVHTGENASEERTNMLGFGRYRNGDDDPSKLIELVRQPCSSVSAIEAAIEVFESAGFEVAVCNDYIGRIVDRLVRPKYNEALRLLDEGVATADDLDLTTRLGLGYPDGLIERIDRGGMVHHYETTRALFEAYGTLGYVPARRALVAKARGQR